MRAGRNRKADYIRKVVADEREKGYMPEYILDAMEKWANRCELGLVKLWEPSLKPIPTDSMPVYSPIHQISNLCRCTDGICLYGFILTTQFIYLLYHIFMYLSIVFLI